VFELGFDFFFGRIDNHGTAFAEDQFLDFNEAEQSTMRDAARVDFVNLSLAHENDFVEILAAHF
jgi:hypothetical protein